MVGARQSGFTYLILLFAIAVISVGLAQLGVITSKQVDYSKRQQLHFVQSEFKRAIESYYLATPGTVKQYPQSLDQLVTDDRFLFVKRHLRKIYKDPFSNKADWGLVRAPDGGISGVYSISKTPVMFQLEYVFLPNS